MIADVLRPVGMDYINADEIQRAVHCDKLEAAKLAETLREDHVTKGVDFCVETVLSTSRNLNLLRSAQEIGFFIRCYYVVAVDPQINIARVASRGSIGGHDVPAQKIIERYDRALALIPELIPLCDIRHIHDNSLSSPYQSLKDARMSIYMHLSSGFGSKKTLLL